MEFLIKKNATLPLLKLQVVKDGRSDYNSFMKLIELSSIYFSMTDLETGIPKIMSRPAGFVEKTFDDPNAETEYYLYYQFTSTDTNLEGRFEGQFMLRNSEGVLILPIREKLFISVQESFIADDLNYESCYVSEFPCCVDFPTQPICPPCPSLPPLTPTPSITPSVTPNYCKVFYSQETGITIIDNSPASVYPVTFYVYNIVNAIDSISLTLEGYTHTYVGDVGMILVSPDGSRYSIITGRKGSVYGINDGTVTLTTLSTTLWDGHSTGTFLNDPTAYSGLLFDSPCPYQFIEGESTLDLSVFITETPAVYANGIWTLYIQDFAPEDYGSLRSATLTICDSGIPRTPTPTPTPTVTPTITPNLVIKGTLFGLVNPGSVLINYYFVLEQEFYADIVVTFNQVLKTVDGDFVVSSEISLEAGKTSNVTEIILDYDFNSITGDSYFTNIQITPSIYNSHFIIEDVITINYPSPTPTPTPTPTPICSLMLTTEDELDITTEVGDILIPEQSCVLLSLILAFYPVNDAIAVSYTLTSSDNVSDNVDVNVQYNLGLNDYFITIDKTLTLYSGQSYTQDQEFIQSNGYNLLYPTVYFNGLFVIPIINETQGYTLYTSYSFNPLPNGPIPPLEPTFPFNPTPTPTPTVTVTNTQTPTVTTTNTLTPSVTNTNTPTPTITETSTQTPTPTVTETPTNTPTPTVTETPTNTPTPTVTETPTQTPTITPTNLADIVFIGSFGKTENVKNVISENYNNDCYLLTTGGTDVYDSTYTNIDSIPSIVIGAAAQINSSTFDFNNNKLYFGNEDSTRIDAYDIASSASTQININPDYPYIVTFDSTNNLLGALYGLATPSLTIIDTTSDSINGVVTGLTAGYKGDVTTDNNGYMYVVGGVSNKIEIVDSINLITAGTITTTTTFGLAARILYNPNNGYLYALNNGDTLEYTTTATTQGVISISGYSGINETMTYNPIKDRIYVGNISNTGVFGVITIDCSTNTILSFTNNMRTGVNTVGYYQTQLYYDNNTNELLVVDVNSNNVYRFTT